MKLFNAASFIRFICFILVYTIVVGSCHKAVPSGFWMDYKKDLIVKSVSDQGPYGGKRAILWEEKSNQRFNTQEFVDVAKKNGWERMDSIFIPVGQLKRWTSNNSFPFTYSQFSDSTVVAVGFPAWMEEDCILYRFSTGWVAVEPVNAKETGKNGYIVFNSDISRVAVYHLWGE